ncbi:MAG: glycosyltransferase family 39 protein, partial [Planctomycetota bacterium]|nr:glycosyltransferase family 39 protein [Planctomycetota bacterium]
MTGGGDGVPGQGLPGGLAPEGRRRTWALVLIVLLGVALRVHHALALADLPTSQQPSMDALYHVQWARAMVAGEPFIQEPYFRLPLYPFFLSLVARVLGDGLLGWRLAQALLGAATILGTYALGRRAFGEGRGLAAALVMATAWLPVHFDTELLIPALFLPLVTWALWATLGLLQAPERSRGALLAGVLWAGATLARPTALVFTAALLLFGVRRGGAERRALLLLLLVWGGLLVPVGLRNRIVGGEWVPLATQAGVNLWIGNNPQSDGSAAIVPGTRAGWWEGFHDGRALARSEAGTDLTAAEVSAHYQGKALAWALDEPAAFLRHLAWKARLALANAELGNNLEPSWFALAHDPWLLEGWVPFAVLHALALVGAVACIRQLRRGRALWRTPLLLFPWTYLAGVVAFFVCARFRLPVWPALAVLAAEGGWTLLSLQGRARLLGWASAVGLTALGYLADPPARFPSESVGRMQLGQAWLGMGEVGKALEELARASTLDPVSPHVRLAYAGALLQVGSWDRAAEQLELLERPLPESRELEVRILLGRGDAEGAAVRARALLGEAPELVGVRYQL